jgi:SAM-dependent methyltransferase
VDGRFGFDPTSVFDPVATEYREARPGYPDELYDTLGQFVGGFGAKAVADVGAGPGTASRELAARGASVVAVEPSLAMLGRPGLAGVCARAEDLPLRSASWDLITCAQAWHWVEVGRAVPECGRVLRMGGHLALWWNVSDSAAAWLEDVEAVSGIGPYGVGIHQDDPAALTASGHFAGPEYRDIAWSWQVPVDRWLKVAATRSSSVATVRAGQRLPVREIREVLDRHFPSGDVIEAFTCHLAVATRI